MSKWVWYGYGARSNPEAISARQEEDELLRKHLPVILANSGQILRTPRHFFCQPLTAFMSSLWIFGGGGPIPLGVLILLWRAGEMIFECPGCGGMIYAVGVSGSILSGCGSVWGPCLDCNLPKNLRRDHVGESILAVGPLLRIYRNEPVIEKGNQPRFDWKDGLVGESTPDKVVVAAVEPAALRTLVEEIGAERGSASAQDTFPFSDNSEARRHLVERARLKGPQDLPALQGDRLDFIWDQADEDEDQVTLIRFEDQILWKEPCFWGGAWRFNEVKLILQAKYGDRYCSFRPTKGSEMYLTADGEGERTGTEPNDYFRSGN